MSSVIPNRLGAIPSQDGLPGAIPGQVNAPQQSYIGPRYQAAAPAGLPELGETLKVKNVGTSVLRFAWNSRQYVIPPGGEDFMPFDGIKVYVGDPRATNQVRTLRDSIGIVSFLPDRATEVRRLRLLYGAPFGEYMTANDVGGIFQDSNAFTAHRPGGAWEGVRIPLVEVYNIRGERITTVLDDPEGMMNIPVTVTQHQVDRTDQLSSIIEGQRRIIDVMAERLGIDPNSPALDNSPNVTGEEPPEEPEPEGEVESHDNGSPKMVYNQRSDTIQPKRKRTDPDPTTFDDLPQAE